jgi:ABC-type Zn uptake system ZnuABC Zn-binding protein ZnuA
LFPAAGLLIIVILLASFTGDQIANDGQNLDHELPSEELILTLPDLEPVDLEGRPLQFIATTSIIGDVVARIGSDKIELLTLMDPGQDHHRQEKIVPLYSGSIGPPAAVLTAIEG